MQPVTNSKVLDPVDEQIRRNLVRFIDESGYAQTQVADMSGVPQASLGRYCRGENAIPASALPGLAEVFGRSVSDFFVADPPAADLDNAPPVFLRHRPGATWSEEDQKDADEFLRRVRSRRTKRNSTKRGS